MKPTRLLSLVLVGLALAAGCDDRNKKNQSTPSQQTGGDQAAAEMPKVGLPYVTKEQYKPVPGKKGGRVVRDTFGEPKSFNPVTSGEGSTTEYTMFMFQGLTSTDVFGGESKPEVAESWTVSDDGLTWTFKLRKEVVFNDGSPLKANDVVFSWNDLIYDNNRPAGKEPRWPNSMRDITTFEGKQIKVEAVDDYTVKFTLPVKIAIFDQIASNEILPQKKYAQAVKDGTFGSAMGTDAKPEDIVGSGPFMLKEYVRGQRVTLKPNPNYWKKDSAGQKLPYLDEFVTLIVRDSNAMLLNFQQGVTDYFALRSGKDVGELKPRQESGKFDLYQLGPAPVEAFVCFNMNEEAAKAGKVAAHKVKWFRDRRFRQAVSYAVDRQGIVRNILRTLGHPQAAPFTLGEGPFVYKDVKPYPRDLAKAKALLEEMGLKDRNGDRILEDEQGNKVSFTINTNSGNNVREEVANFVRKDLSELGMDVNTLFLEFNLLVDKTDVTFDWECLVFSLTNSPDPHWGANVWKSNSRLHLWWPYQKTPSTDWEKRIDEIFALGIQEMDKTKRRALYREWVEIMHREQPMVHTAVPERIIASRKRLGNWFPPPYPNIYVIWHNLDEVFIKE